MISIKINLLRINGQPNKNASFYADQHADCLQSVNRKHDLFERPTISGLGNRISP